MRKKGTGKIAKTVLCEVQALDGRVEITEAWVEDKLARFPGADVRAVVDAYRARCEADREERVTVWGMERQLTRLVREDEHERRTKGGAS